jgi:hypothetical protein
VSLGPGALPLGQLIALDLFFPPVGAAFWWAMSRGVASVFQGGDVSERSRKYLNRSFWFILAAAYLLMFGITIFAYFKA